MKMRKLGENGPTVSAIGLGCMGLNYHRGPAPARKEMMALVRAAVERDVTFFDTARSMVLSQTRNLLARRLSRSGNAWSSPPSSASTSAQMGPTGSTAVPIASAKSPKRR